MSSRYSPDHIIPELVDHFEVESYPGDLTPDFSFFCFATSPEEALIKFESELYPYRGDHNINYPLADAKYMLIVCSAFISYMYTKIQ